MIMLLPVSRTAFAQVTPAAGYTPPDDTPSIRVGATLYMNYSYQTDPKIADADGNIFVTPGNKIPALRFAFSVTPSSKSTPRAVTGTR